jgi:hypothetical protein
MISYLSFLGFWQNARYIGRFYPRAKHLFFSPAISNMPNSFDLIDKGRSIITKEKYRAAE